MTEVKNGEVKINNKNMLIGLVLMVVCVYIGAITTMPHQSEIITTAVNIPAQFAQEAQTPVKEETVTVALESNTAVINAINLTTMAKIIVIVCVAGIVFILLSTTGLIPRFGGES